MGIPSFTRWLLDKYKSCNDRYLNSNSRQSSTLILKTIKKGVDESTLEKGSTIIVSDNDEYDYCLIQPFIEFDNLYIDMNGIVHEITRKDGINLDPPYDDIREEFFKKLDDIINTIHPFKLLFLALDGVSPRAKTNQQRARRYVASLDKSNRKFDSNQISPGTFFMDKVNEWSKMYVEKNLASNPLWEKLCVILSDSSIPGEGEHKIMDYIRSQKGSDNKIRHCIYSADSDLFVLALSLHEETISILREETFYTDNRLQNNLIIIRSMPKDISKDMIKSLFEFYGKITSIETIEQKKESRHFVITFEEIGSAQNALKSTIRFDNQLIIRPQPHSIYSDASKDRPLYAVTLVNVPSDVKEEHIKNIFEEYDIIRIKIVLDSNGASKGICIVEFKSEEDQLKALQKSENFQINGTSVKMYPTKPKVLYPKDFVIYEFLERTGCYSENLAQEHLIMNNWDLEEAITKYNNNDIVLTVPTLPTPSNNIVYSFFHIHTLKEYLFHEFKHAMELLAEKDEVESFKFDMARVIDDFVLLTMLVGNDFLPHLPGCTARNIDVILRIYKEFLHREHDYLTENETINVNNFKKVLEEIVYFESFQLLKFSKNIPIQEDDPSTIDTVAPLVPIDELKEVRHNYYHNKLRISATDTVKIKMIAQDFFQGIIWMYSYYYKGLQSWSWFYPHHYAPLTKDLAQYIDSLNLDELSKLERSEPLQPIEHLLSVLPPSSAHLVPEVCRYLMLDGSPVKEFYPEEFILENDAGMPSWAAIPILPIINVELLINTIKPLEKEFTEDERNRNKFGKIFVYCNTSNNIESCIHLPPHDNIQAENSFKRIELEYEAFANMEHKMFNSSEIFGNNLTLEDLNLVENTNKRLIKGRAKVEKSEYEGLAEYIDFQSSECLNMKPENKLQNLFLTEGFIESDVDEQLLINLKFKSPLNLQAIQFLGPKENGPKTIKLYSNRGTLSFEDIEDTPMTQSFVLKNEDETVNIMASKFTKCYSLTIFIEDNQNESDQTRINSISFIGNAG